ncbi:MAG: Serine/threonine protein kinase PrkC, regulator of stationary phase [Myxococcaceae bacterium]|nr:Serine/threonine protein kinase PrkC, regulator of stationary phase [Myxococcaceae bacterium]
MNQPSQTAFVGASFAPGAVLAGKYRIERQLGIGGMGIVLLARHLQLDELVAVKLLLPDFVTDEEFVQRFFREGRAAAKIKSEHVTRVLDVGALENGQPFIVMEYLDGSDLGKVLEVRGRLPIALAVEYLVQASDAIAEAHKAGIVHRDLKPSNLFLTTRRDGSACVKVMDFGIAKVIDPTKADFQLTRTASVLGSPLYMAPEQMRSTRHVDPRADIWALGTILYELVAGSPPFFAATMPELCAMILQDPPPKLQTRRPDVPAELARAIVRALEKQPEKRFDSVSDFARAIARFGGANVEAVARTISKVDIPKLSPRASSTPRLGSVTDASWSDVSEPELPEGDARVERRPHYIAAGLGALVAVVLAVIAVVVVLRLRAERATAATPTTTPSLSSATLPPPAVDPTKPAVVATPPEAPTAVVSPTPIVSATTPTSATQQAATTTSPKPTTTHATPRPTTKPSATVAPTVPPPASAKPPPESGLSNDRHG